MEWLFLAAVAAVLLLATAAANSPSDNSKQNDRYRNITVPTKRDTTPPKSIGNHSDGGVYPIKPEPTEPPPKGARYEYWREFFEEQEEAANALRELERRLNNPVNSENTPFL